MFPLAARVDDRRLMGSYCCPSAPSAPSFLCGVDATSPIPSWHLLPSWAPSRSQRGEADFSAPSASVRRPVVGLVQTAARGPVILLQPALAASEGRGGGRVPRLSECLLRNYSFLSPLPAPVLGVTLELWAHRDVDTVPRPL